MTPEDQARLAEIRERQTGRWTSDADVIFLLRLLDAATAGKPAGEYTVLDAVRNRMLAAEQRVAEQDIMIGNLTTAYEESLAETVAAEKRVAELEQNVFERVNAYEAKMRECNDLRTALTAAEAKLRTAANLMEDAARVLAAGGHADGVIACLNGEWPRIHALLRPAVTQAKEAADDHAG